MFSKHIDGKDLNYGPCFVCHTEKALFTLIIMKIDKFEPIQKPISLCDTCVSNFQLTLKLEI